MKTCYIGLEFTHSKLHPRAKVKVKTRFGPIKRWVDEQKPMVVDGELRERVALKMPLGFRFCKDEVKPYIKHNRTYADGKFFVAMAHAQGKYTPHHVTPRTGLDAETPVSVTRDEDATGNVVSGPGVERSTVAGDS